MNAALPYFRNDPIGFVRIVLQAEPDPWQQKVLLDVRDKKYVAVRSCTGAGKDALAAWIIIWFLCCFEDASVPCTANSEDQLYDVLWAEIKIWMDHSLGGIVHTWLEWTQTEVRHRSSPEHWKAVNRTTSVRVAEDGTRQAEGIAGFHRKHMLIIIDEASGVDSAPWDVLEMTMTDPQNKIFVIGNPTRVTGRFFEIWHKLETSKRWTKTTVAALDPAEYGVKASIDFITDRPDRALAEMQVNERGATDIVVMSKVFGIHPTASSSDTGFSFDEVTAAMERTVEVSDTDDVQIGVDCARFGDDETVFMVRRGFKITRIETLNRSSVPEIARMVKTLCDEEFDPTRPDDQNRPLVCIDETGVGGGVCDILWEDGYYNVIGVEFGSQAYQFEKYENLAAEMWLDHVKRMLPYLELPEDENLRNQLISRKYGFSKDGSRMRLEAKKDMKKRGLGSPDRADALCLACVTPSTPGIG